MRHVGSLFPSSVKPIAVSLFILVIVGLSGCATSESKPYALPPPPRKWSENNLELWASRQHVFPQKLECLNPRGRHPELPQEQEWAPAKRLMPGCVSETCGDFCLGLLLHVSVL
jgi:hypothetical protein